MKRLWVSAALTAAICVVGAGTASAQTDPGSRVGPAVQHSPDGIDYISGGVGEEDRTAMAARQGEFPFKVVLSAAGGEYLVADHLNVTTPQGKLLIIRDAGPVVMMKLPPGAYTFEATYQGKTERRPVRVGAGAQTLNWRFPG